MTHLIFDMTVPSCCVALPGATEMTTTHTFFGEFQVFAKPHPVCTWPGVRFAAKPKLSQMRFTNSAKSRKGRMHFPPTFCKVNEKVLWKSPILICMCWKLFPTKYFLLKKTKQLYSFRKPPLKHQQVQKCNTFLSLSPFLKATNLCSWLTVSVCSPTSQQADLCRLVPDLSDLNPISRSGSCAGTRNQNSLFLSCKQTSEWIRWSDQFIRQETYCDHTSLTCNVWNWTAWHSQSVDDFI